MPSLISPGKIHHLELENFKSYKGFQTIGPFHDFTAIIGPNGAGKSNLMDAISFVLGVRSVQLRGAQLKDLIYAFDDREKEQKGRKAFVRLVYHMGNGSEIQFTRTITGAGGSEYRIDGRIVMWDEYNAKLKSLGILVKARNFLVFQVLILHLTSIACVHLYGITDVHFLAMSEFAHPIKEFGAGAKKPSVQIFFFFLHFLINFMLIFCKAK